MRLVTYSSQNQIRLGALITQHTQAYVLDLNRAQPTLPDNLIDFLNAGKAALTLAQGAAAAPPLAALQPLTAVTLLAPIPHPGKILCIGHNYDDHLGLDRTAPAEYPNFFCKTGNTIIGHQQALIIPRVTTQVDYEAELAVVMGKRARYVSEAQAMAHVAGYTIFNDVSARDYQKRGSQWFLGKSFDTFGPLGPALVTTDEIADPHNLELTLTLNGLEMQHTNTRHMVFSIPYLIAYLSDVLTLEPGDIIATGTPAKTDLARSLPPFMKVGDVVSIRVEQIGELTNPILSENDLH